MSELWGWVASGWRRSWRSLVGLTLLVAFGGAITIAAPAATLLAVGYIASLNGFRTARLDPARTLRGE